MVDTKLVRKEKKPLRLWWRILLIIIGLGGSFLSTFLIFYQEDPSPYPWIIFVASLSLSVLIFGIYVCIVYELRYRWDNRPPQTRGKMICIEDKRVSRKKRRSVTEWFKDLIWKCLGLSVMYIIFLLYFIKDPKWAIALIPFIGTLFVLLMLLINYKMSLRRSEGNIFFWEGVYIHSGFSGKRFVKYHDVHSLKYPEGNDKYFLIQMKDKTKLHLLKNKNETKYVIDIIQRKLDARRRMGKVIKKVHVK